MSKVLVRPSRGQAPPSAGVGGPRPPLRLWVSFSHTQFQRLQSEWVRRRVGLGDAPILGSSRRESLREPGLMVLMDFPSGRIVASASHPRAAGFVMAEAGLVLCAGHHLRILDSVTLRTVRKISHPPFNNLRSIVRDGKGYLVSDAGVDTVFHLDSQFRIEGAWNATEHGFDVTPLGKMRRVSLRVDHRRRVYSTLEQATHVNSALPLKGGAMLVCLFHQGAVVHVGPRGGARTILNGLRGPHAIRRASSGFMVSDSWNRRIVFFGKNGRSKRVWDLSSQADWIQDAVEIGRGNLLVADAGNARVARVNSRTGKVLDSCEFSPQWKIFQIELVRV